MVSQFQGQKSGKAQEPASRARSIAPGGRLPAPVTALVGREREVPTIRELLRQPSVRLVTLTGAGGVGKTRVALEVARYSHEDFSGGVCFVPLAEVPHPGHVAPAIAQAAGVHEDGRRSLAEAIIAALWEQQTLLVLDNFEHVIEAAPLVSELLAACSSLSCLVTSRAVLRISGEHAFPLPPLPLPPLAEATDAGRAGASPAVQLFVSRARAVQAGFTLTDENASAVEAICRRLDGLPLAIELAAARVRHLTPAVLLQQLSDGHDASSLRMLTGGPRDAPDRQRALRHAIAWSYELLSLAEQALFRRVAVFVGGFRLEAAESVAQAWQGAAGPQAPVIELVAGLVDQSLLWHDTGSGGESRYTMLETVREFGLEQLTTAGEEPAVLGAHAGYYQSLVEQGAPALHTHAQAEWVARLNTEYANIRAALTWLSQVGRGRDMARMTWALFWFWMFEGRYTEGLRWYERALDMSDDIPPFLRQTVLMGASHFAWVLGNVARSEAAAREALALEDEIGGVMLPGVSEMMLCKILYWRGDTAIADAMGERALTKLRAADSREGAVMLRIALNDIGLYTSHAGNAARGIPLLEEALTLVDGTGDLHLAGVHWADLGLAYQAAADHVQAERCFLEALRVHRAIGAEWYLATSLSGLAASADRREPAWAAQLLGAADALRRRNGQPNWTHEQPRDTRVAARLKALLGDESYAAEHALGAEMPVQEAIERALAGASNTALSPQGMATWRHPLSPRELEVLRCLIGGMTDQEIADTLFISRRTASKHVGAILAKLDVASRDDAVTLALHERLI